MYQKEQVGELYWVLAQSQDVDEAVFPILIKILKREKINDCLDFFSENLNQRHVEQEVQKEENQSLFGKEKMVKVGKNNIMRITDALKKLKDHEFNKKNYSIDEYEVNKNDLIIKISQDIKIIEFLKFLVHLTALDERYIQSGSNSLHLLVLMKLDLRQYSFENIRIRDTTLVGGNFVRCNFNGSEFDNVDISGMNLNQAQLFGCKWKNIKIPELNKLDGHGQRVNQVCFSSNGKSLASCSDDNLIKFWDVKTGKERSKIIVKGAVKSVCFSPKNTILAFSSGTFVFLWDLKTGKQKAKLDGHSGRVYSVYFSPDGTTLASGSDDYSIRLWDAMTGQQKAKLDGHSDYVMSVNFSPDGTTLASVSQDYSIRLWDIKTSKEILQSDSNYNHLLAQFTLPLQNSSLLPNDNPDRTILRICQNPQLEASGTLILYGQFINHQGEDLKPMFKFKGSCLLENLKQK